VVENIFVNRTVSPLAVALLIVFAGCTGVGGPTTTTPTTTPTETTTTTTETPTTTTTTTTIDHEATRQKRDSGAHDYMTVEVLNRCNASYEALRNRSLENGTNGSTATKAGSGCPGPDVDFGVLPNETNDTFAVGLTMLSESKQGEFWGAVSGDGKLETPEAWGRYESGYVYHEDTWYQVLMSYG